MGWSWVSSIGLHAVVFGLLLSHLATSRVSVAVRAEPDAVCSPTTFMIESDERGDEGTATRTAIQAPAAIGQRPAPALEGMTSETVGGTRVLATADAQFSSPTAMIPLAAPSLLHEPAPPSPPGVHVSLASAEESATAPVPVHGNPAPRYPDECRRKEQRGTATLRVRVRPDGSVESVALERSSGVALLDESAIDAARGWRFAPARIGGAAVTADVVLPISFTIRR